MITILSDNRTDQNYEQNKFVISNPIIIYVEQIKMALQSDTGSIMGSEDFFDLEDLVFEQNLNEQQIQDRVRQTISHFCSFYENFDTEIDVRFTKGEVRDICLVNITVNKEHTLNLLIQ